jgi:integrase
MADDWTSNVEALTPEKAAERLIGKSITTHGFRSSFRSFIAAKTSFPSEMAELALAHNVGDETYRAYQRDDLVERRREMMKTWQDHCDGKALEGVNIITFKAVEKAA